MTDLLAGAPPVGSRLPDFPGSDVVLPTDGPGSDTVLLFLSSTCEPCLRLGEQLELNADGESDDALRLRRSKVVVITDEAGLPIYAGPAMTQVITQADGEISRQLGITASPFGIAVDSTGTVRAVNVPGSFAAQAAAGM